MILSASVARSNSLKYSPRELCVKRVDLVVVVLRARRSVAEKYDDEPPFRRLNTLAGEAMSLAVVVGEVFGVFQDVVYGGISRLHGLLSDRSLAEVLIKAGENNVDPSARQTC